MSFLSYSNLHLNKIKWFIFFAVSIPLISINFMSGPYSSPDTGSYSRLADSLIEHKFNFFAFFQRESLAVPIYFYTVPITLFAIAKEISAEYWKLIILVLNTACIPAIILLTSRIVNLTGQNKYLTAFFPLIFLFSYDYVLWARYILSDTIYCLSLIWCVYFVISSQDNKGWKNNSIFMISILLLFLSRPSSPPSICVLLFFYFIPSYIAMSRPMIWGLLFSVPIVFIAWAALLWLYLSSTLQIEGLDFITAMIKDGVVIHHRPETHIEYKDNYISILQILLTRFLYFFAPYSNAWSMAHIGISALFFSIIALPVLISEICVDNSRVKNHIALKAKAILIFTILSIAVYHSMTLIDYDWRYRYPVIALMMALAAIEISLFLEQKPFSFNKKARHS